NFTGSDHSPAARELRLHGRPERGARRAAGDGSFRGGQMIGAYGVGTSGVSPSPFTPWNPYANAYGTPIHQVIQLLQIVPQQLQQLQQLSAVQQQQLQQLQQALHVIPAQLQQLIPLASYGAQQQSPFQSPFGHAGLGGYGVTSPFGIGPQ